MNAPDKLDALLSLTREPFPASCKTYLSGSRDDLRVPLREVALSNGEKVSLYDTSGPYTDPAATLDVRCGLPCVRTAWIADRGDTERYKGTLALAFGRRHEACSARRTARRAAPCRR